MNNSRALAILGLILIISVIITIRLVNIQMIQKEKYAQFAVQQQTSIEKIKAELGLIYDRNNNLLVYNRNDVTFYIDLNISNDKNKREIASKFSKVMGKSENYYLSLMNKPKGTIVLQSKVQPEQFQKLNDLNYEELYSVPDPTRVYHYGSLASHILGFTNKEHELVSGVSEFFSQDLSGTEGYRKVFKNSLGKIVSYDEREMQEPVPGHNLILTIDKKYQIILEEELKKGLEQFQAHSATGIIMNPNTGEILALSNMEDYDPNYYWQYDDFRRRNRAITDTYEPGSTFKPFTFAALIDNNLCSLNENIFLENGSYKFQKVTIRDVKPYSFLTAEDILVNSSNIGIAKLVQRIKNDDYYKFLRSLGFGNLTSIQIKGETPGRLKKPTSWSPTSKAFISFGYEVSVTPIQLITAFASLINGGVLYQPQLLYKKISYDGELIEELKPKPVRRVVSESTSSLMRKILSDVVTRGTAKQASIEFISVGGKTGTSQKLVDGSYSKSQYNTSFIGFFPVEDPQVVILIHYNSPQLGKYGGLVAAPVFKRVAERIIEKDFNVFEKYVNEKFKQRILYSDLNSSQNKNSENSLNENKFSSSKVMPDLINHPLSEAISVLNRIGINYKVKGSGIVVNQSLPAGSKISDKDLCLIECSSLQIIGASQR
jgi:cell division protein FtsI (penicillin-binding protein 3)